MPTLDYTVGLRPNERHAALMGAWLRCPRCGSGLVMVEDREGQPGSRIDYACIDPEEEWCGWRESDGPGDMVVVSHQEKAS